MSKRNQVRRVKGIIRKISEKNGYDGIRKIEYYIHDVENFKGSDIVGMFHEYNYNLNKYERTFVMGSDINSYIRNEKINTILGIENKEYPIEYNRGRSVKIIRKIALEKGHLESVSVINNIDYKGYLHRTYINDGEYDNVVGMYQKKSVSGRLKMKYIFLDDVIDYEKRNGIKSLGLKIKTHYM